MKQGAIAVVLALGVPALFPSHAGAQDASAISPAIPSRERAAAIVISEERAARDWGLSTDDWTRYRELMAGPLGVYSPNLDPLTALGIEARSDEERRRYAELQVVAEARRIEKTLAYQRAYDDAWQRLHPGLERIAFAGAGDRESTAGSGRLAVFVRDGCAECGAVVQRLQSAGTGFDLYMVGTRQDDERIREWARNVRIDPARVREGTITLNHNSGRWLSMGLEGNLPAIVREVNGQWQRQ